MLSIQMASVARQLCLNAGGDAWLRGEGAGAILKTLSNCSQPESLGRVCQQVAKFPHYTRADQTMEYRLLDVGVFRRKAGARVIRGGASPGGAVSILCTQNAALPRAEKSFLLAIVEGSLVCPFVAEQMRRLFDPCGRRALQESSRGMGRVL